VSGASGAGKSTVCRILLGRLSQVVILDSDILWRPEFNLPEYNSPDFIDTWLRMCKNISQSGRPVVLFGAGMGIPDNIEPRIERRYFAAINYLALVCDDQLLAERLRQRPKWRGSHEHVYVEEHQRFNQWFKAYGALQPPIHLLDTTSLDEETTANRVEIWINERLRASGCPEGAEDGSQGLERSGNPWWHV